MAVAKSYDNEPYVTYVRDDAYFRSLFNGLELGELSELDLFEHGVEGVSGATMTSMAVADGLVLAAAGPVRSNSKPQRRKQLKPAFGPYGQFTISARRFVS